MQQNYRVNAINRQKLRDEKAVKQFRIDKKNDFKRQAAEINKFEDLREAALIRIKKENEEERERKRRHKI